MVREPESENTEILQKKDNEEKRKSEPYPVVRQIGTY